jgi:cytochrome c
MENKLLRAILCGLLVISLCCLVSTVKAEPNDPAKEKLAKESEEAAKASAKDKATPELIIKKVTEAAALLEKEGKAAFVKFQGKDSQFIFAGTCIWIHDMEGVMQMHPIKYKMNGQRITGMKDINGKLFFAEMNRIAKEKGSGWVSYMWPKPGEKDPSLKVSYVKLCKVDGVEMVVGCGVYGFSEDEVKKLTQ